MYFDSNPKAQTQFIDLLRKRALVVGLALVHSQLSAESLERMGAVLVVELHNL